MRKLLVIALLLLPVVSQAQTASPPAPPPAPETLIMPTAWLEWVRAYLGSRPSDDTWQGAPTANGTRLTVRDLINLWHGCVTVQLPSASGVTMDRGECPAVSQERRKQQEYENKAAALDKKPEGEKKAEPTPPAPKAPAP